MTIREAWSLQGCCPLPLQVAITEPDHLYAALQLAAEWPAGPEVRIVVSPQVARDLTTLTHAAVQSLPGALASELHPWADEAARAYAAGIDALLSDLRHLEGTEAEPRPVRPTAEPVDLAPLPEGLAAALVGDLLARQGIADRLDALRRGTAPSAEDDPLTALLAPLVSRRAGRGRPPIHGPDLDLPAALAVAERPQVDIWTAWKLRLDARIAALRYAKPRSPGHDVSEPPVSDGPLP